METLSSRKIEDRFGNPAAGRLDALLYAGKIIRIQDDERPSRLWP